MIWAQSRHPEVKGPNPGPSAPFEVKAYPKASGPTVYSALFRNKKLDPRSGQDPRLGQDPRFLRDSLETP